MFCGKQGYSHFGKGELLTCWGVMFCGEQVHRLVERVNSCDFGELRFVGSRIVGYCGKGTFGVLCGIVFLVEQAIGHVERGNS